MFRINGIKHKDDWRKVSRRKEDFTSLNAPTVADYEYTYSKGLHLIGKQENEENRRTAYQYDSYYRLRRVDYNCAYNADDPTCANNRNNVFKCNQSETDCEDFQLDGVHNIRSSYENQTGFSWTVDGFNRLTQKSDGSNTVKYTYDSNNNMIGEDLDGDQNIDIAYTYDKLNRLTSVTNSDYLVEYSYDPFNRRTEKTVYYADGNDTYERTHKYAYDGWDIISEEIKTVRTSDTPNTVTGWQLRRYVDQGTDNHIIMDTVSCSDDGNGNCSPNESTLQRIWFHKDERGNIIAISDGNGTIYERYRYRVYGEHEVLNADFTTKSTAAISPFLWGGSLYETETNLYWMRNRYYHIDMHRFINQDPIGIWGDANNLGNGFAYVAGMVIEASDPSGLEYDVWTRNSDGTTSGYYASYANRDAAGTISEATGIFTSLYALVLSIGVLPTSSVALRFVSTETIDFAMQLIPNSSTKIGLNHLESTFGNESAEIIISIGSQLAESVGAKGFYYKDNGDGTVELTAVGSDGKEVKKTINLEEEKLKRDLEEADKFEEPPTSKDIDLKNEESSSIGTSNERSVDPDSGEDMFQRYLRAKILKKRLKVDDNSDQDKPLIVIETETPIGKTKIVVHNPYYKNIDPLKRLMKGKDPNSRTLIFNPFLPPESTEYRNTYEKITQGGGIVMPNVDPYLW